MSWSYSGCGKPQAVSDKAIEHLSAIQCAEPEQTIKSLVIGIINASLSAYPDASRVNVEAAGSQSVMEGGKFVNYLTIKINPLYGFVE